MMSLRVGFVALCDAAPLIIAERKGFYELEGVAVELVREPSWSNIRDKLVTGHLDAAQILGPMSIASHLDPMFSQNPIRALMALNTGTAAISFSQALAGQDLREEAARRAAAGQAPIRLATVFPFSLHTYFLTGWLAAQGLRVGPEASLVTFAPTRMLEKLLSGEIDGFCAGEPWNSFATVKAQAQIVEVVDAFLPGAPDKFIGATTASIAKNRAALIRVIAAVQSACLWCADPANRAELIDLVADEIYLGEAARTPGAFDRARFLTGDEARPIEAQAVWLFDQMRAAGQVEPGDCIDRWRAAFDPALFDEIAALHKNGAPI